MRNTNNMLKSALTALALATMSTAVLANGDVALTSNDSSASSDANASKSSDQRIDAQTLVVVDRPTPPAVADSPVVRADLNHDGHHTMDDLVLLLTSWGACPAIDAVCSGDINLDGLVDTDDMIYLIRLINIDSSQAS